MKFRELTANEVEARVGTQSESGVTLLLYKNARVDMAILDESGCKWQKKYYECKGNLFCSVGIYDEDLKEWIWKDDCGTESYTEKEKGEASDAFKRACFNWGIGRELYTAPFMWISADKLEFSKDAKGQTKLGSNGKPIIKTKFRVKDIEIIDGKIEKLCISDSKGNDLFTEGYETPKKTQAYVCEGCNSVILPTTGKNDKYISISEIVQTSKEVTKKNYGEAHILCPSCLHKPDVVKGIINGK